MDVRGKFVDGCNKVLACVMDGCEREEEEDEEKLGGRRFIWGSANRSVDAGSGELGPAAEEHQNQQEPSSVRDPRLPHAV